jgi:hypothetical protein
VNVYTSNASLIIHPDDPDWAPDDPEKIIVALRQIGLIAENIQGEEHSYLVGDHFLDLIAFLGCSPSISLSPQDNADKFCRIRLKTKQTITALTSKHTHAPHCPHCKKPEKNWLSGITTSALQCSSCGQTAPPWEYNWRKSAGFGRFFIEVTEIYPKEAIPQDALLTDLKNSHNTNWSYFYLYSQTGK